MLVLIAASGCDEPLETNADSPDLAALSLGDFVEREALGGDLAHYTATLRLGPGPNGSVRLHRVVREIAPWKPAATEAATMLLHGDFSSFATNFLPRDSSGAGVRARGRPGERRHRRVGARPPVDPRASRPRPTCPGLRTWALTRSSTTSTQRSGSPGRTVSSPAPGAGRLSIAGFSRGAHLGYAYAARDGARPVWRRKLAGLVALDMYAEISPDDDHLRDAACARAAEEQALLELGELDSDNSFFVAAGELALSAPNEISPLFGAPFTNRDTLLILAGQTYFFFFAADFYHLAAVSFEAGIPTAFSESAEDAVGRWFAGASPHQSLREVAEGDALWCGEQPPPIEIDLARVRAPVLYIGAAGGIGDAGVYTTTLLGSDDVTAEVIRRFEPGREHEDIGHGDLLLADDAADLVSAPISEWIHDL